MHSKMLCKMVFLFLLLGGCKFFFGMLKYLVIFSYLMWHTVWFTPCYKVHCSVIGSLYLPSNNICFW
jgi:hypothetical protein